MNYLLSQIFLCLLAAFILGAIIGWLWRHITCKNCRDELLKLQKEIAELRSRPVQVKQTVKVPEPVPVPKKVEVAKVVETPATEDAGMPVFLSEPRNGKGDDLKRIKGVGKVLEATLYDRGVYHFDQISTWSEENAQWMDTFMQFPGRIEREGWIEQAKLLAEGGETEFSKKVDENHIYD